MKGELTKYGPDVSAFVASQNRETVQRVTCRFTASGSGSYFSRSCRNLAQWAEGWKDDDGNIRIGDYPHLRCNRHRALDERTRRNDRYGYLTPRDYAVFNGMAEAVARDKVVAAAAEFDRLAKVHGQVEASLAYVLKHAVLATDERNSLQQVMADLKKGTLEVR